jgi:hypothetical protein
LLSGTRYLSNNNQTLPSALRYDAFGNQSRAGGTDPYPTPYQWAGAWGNESEPQGGSSLGLVYMYQRYYDPVAGRFLTQGGSVIGRL